MILNWKGLSAYHKKTSKWLQHQNDSKYFPLSNAGPASQGHLKKSQTVYSIGCLCQLTPCYWSVIRVRCQATETWRKAGQTGSFWSTGKKIMGNHIGGSWALSSVREEWASKGHSPPVEAQVTMWRIHSSEKLNHFNKARSPHSYFIGCWAYSSESLGSAVDFFPPVLFKGGNGDKCPFSKIHRSFVYCWKAGHRRLELCHMTAPRGMISFFNYSKTTSILRSYHSAFWKR